MDDLKQSAVDVPIQPAPSEPIPSFSSVNPDPPAAPSEPIPSSPFSVSHETPDASPPEALDWGISPKDSSLPLHPSVEMPTPASSEETLVIPPAEAEAKANPFIPQGVNSSVNAGAQSPPPQGNSPFKRIIMIIVFLLILLGIGFGAKYLLGKIGGTKEVTITYWGLWEDNPVMQRAIDAFQTVNPKIKVQYVKQSSRQYRERLQAAIARGDGPDVFQFHNTWVPMLRNELSQAPETFMTAAEFGTTFYPVASSDLVGGQTIYGAPLMFDGLGLYYNEDLFTAAGAKLPTTWPELLEIIPSLTKKTDSRIEQSAIALGTTGNVENFSDIVGLMMMQNGAKLANPIGKEAEDTLLFYRKFANPSDPIYTWDETMDNSISAFAMGKVAMILAPSWRVFEIKQISPNLNFKIAPVPQLPGNTINWASYWAGGVSTKSKNQEAAWIFLKYLTSRDTMTMLYGEEAKLRLFGEPYARVDLASTLTSDPYVGAYIQEALTAKSFPLASRTFDNGINDKLIQYLTDAVNAVGQGTAPTAALETAASGFSQVLTSYGLSSGAAPQTTP